MLTLLLMSLASPRRTRRDVEIDRRVKDARRDGVAFAVDRLNATAAQHRGRPGDATRRKALRAAAQELDATIGHHAQRRAAGAAR